MIGFLLEGYFVLCRMDWCGGQGDPLETCTVARKEMERSGRWHGDWARFLYLTVFL